MMGHQTRWMRGLTVLVMSSCVFLLGACQGPSQETSQGSKASQGYPAEVLQVNLKSCRSNCERSFVATISERLSASDLETLKPKYEPKLKAFCDASCECTFDKVQKEVPYAQFAEFEAYLASHKGQPPEGPVTKTLLKCTEECAESSMSELNALKEAFQSLRPQEGSAEGH